MLKGFKGMLKTYWYQTESFFFSNRKDGKESRRESFSQYVIECAVMQHGKQAGANRRVLLHWGLGLPRVLGLVFPVVGEGRGESGFLLGPCMLEKCLQRDYAFESPGELVKMQILLQ